ncbi:MAG: DUF2490 domain-containing protein [Bacteriovoracaceae bacterium]
MNNIFFRFFLFSSLLLCRAVLADVSDKQIWPFIFVQGRIVPLVSTQVMYQPRMVSNGEKYAGSILQANSMYAFSKKFSAGLGYFYIPWKSPNQYDEHRPFTQAIYQFSEKEWSFLFRSRLEFRRMEDRPETIVRLRKMFRTNYQLDRYVSGLYAFSFDELFYNFNTIETDKNKNSPAPHQGFDQNRFCVGLGLKFGEKYKQSFEAGYLNQKNFRYLKDNLNNDVLYMQYVLNLN